MSAEGISRRFPLAQSVKDFSCLSERHGSACQIRTPAGEKQTMYQSSLTVNFGNLLLSLSDALELSNPSLMQHQMRTAYVAWEIAKRAGLTAEEIETIFLAALFHDIGALTPEEKILIHSFEEVDADRHCFKGKLLFELVPWLAPAAPLVRYHHREWQEWSADDPAKLVCCSQILLLADHLERRIDRSKYILLQNEEILADMQSLAGSVADPELVDCLRQAADREEFWLDLTSPRLYSLLLNFGPYQRRELSIDDLSEIANVFSFIIDFRSQFTATHSAGVAECAKRLADHFGLTSTEVKMMEIAGQLHDLGKLSIPNAILEKPSGLTREEFAVIKRHTYYTYSILNTIGGLGPIPEWGALHHEKLDGNGYPFRLPAQDIGTGSRIMQVADLFTAMAESRPYRKMGMPKDQIVRIFCDRVNEGTLDRRITGLVLNNYDVIREQVLARQEEVRMIYDSQFADAQTDSELLCA